MAVDGQSQATKQPQWTIKHRLHHDSGVTTVAMSPNGREVAAGGILSPTISLWDVETGTRVRVLKGLKGSTQAVAYSPDGRFFAAGRGMITSADTCVFVFQAGADIILQRLQPPPIATRFAPKGVGMVESLQYSPDGQFLAVGFAGGAIGIYEAATGQLKKRMTLNSSLQGPVAYSPNGKSLAFGQWKKEEGELLEHYVIQFLDVDSGEVVKTLSGHTGTITALAFDPHGDLLASGTSTGARRSHFDMKTKRSVNRLNEDPIRIWDIKSGAVAKEFGGHTGTVRHLAFYQDGQYLVSGSYDKTVRIWNLVKGEAVATLTEPNDLIGSIAVTSEGKYLVSGGNSGDVTVWERRQ